jgi:hypothetical protein
MAIPSWTELVLFIAVVAAVIVLVWNLPKLRGHK